MSDFISDDEGYDYDDFIYHDESIEDISSEASEDSSDLENLYSFPITPLDAGQSPTAHRQKYIVRYEEFEYY